MTYDTERKKAAKEPIIMVELDLDYCSRTFGVAPCTATAATGDDKCRNTLVTCRDRQNYANSPITYRFAEIHARVPPIAKAIPCVHSVRPAPTVRNPSKGLGARASVKVVLKDFPWHDRDIDQYASERSFSYEDRGTYFGRLIASNPYYEGRPMRIWHGFLGDPFSFDNFKERHYLIDKIDGPDSRGRVTITAKDPLKALDSGRHEYPSPTDSALTENINPNATTFGVTNIQFYSDGDYFVINDEAMRVTTVNVPSSQLEGVLRGLGETNNVSHSSGDSVQIMGVYSLQNCITAAKDLIINKANVSASYIDNTAWDAVQNEWFTGFNVERIIPEPTSINELLSSLMEQCGFDVWWNERTQKIDLKAIAPSQSDVAYNDNDNFLQGTIKITAQQDDRVSQVWYYWDKDKWLEPDKPQWYSRVTIITSGESANEYPESRIRTIFGSWIPDVSGLIVSTVAGRLINRFKNPPIKVQFSLELKDSDLWTGSDFIFDSRTHQDPFGNNNRIACEVLEAAEVDDVIKYRAQFTGQASTRYGEIAPNNLGITYETASQAQRDQYMFISNNDGLMSDGTAGYAIA